MASDAELIGHDTTLYFAEAEADMALEPYVRAAQLLLNRIIDVSVSRNTQRLTLSPTLSAVFRDIDKRAEEVAKRYMVRAFAAAAWAEDLRQDNSTIFLELRDEAEQAAANNAAAHGS